MKERKRRELVDNQKITEITGNTNTYEEYISKYGNIPLNEPDMLAAPEDARPSNPQMLMGEAIAHLQGRQKEVYLLCMREGRSLSMAGEILGISKATAQVHLDRAVKFISGYCRAAIERGRV